MRKIALLVSALCFALALLSGPAAPAAAAGSTISFRVEGMDRTLFYDDAFTLGGPTQVFLRSVVDTYNSFEDVPVIAMFGEGPDARITAVGTLREKSLGGPFGDVWLIRINGESAVGGFEELRVKAGDELVIYYADPTLIQYPRIDLTRMITDGIVQFTSDDVTTDEAGVSYVTENPVVGATVVWDGMKYRTSTSGEIIIDSTGAGVAHTVSIERYYDNGLPTVLRFAPGYFVKYGYHDVSGDDWFFDAVMFASDRRLMSGVSEVNFGPELSMSRAMFVTVLGRMAGAKVDQSAPSRFSDVKNDGWSAGYIEWAVESGIAGGRPDGTFGPYESISREQLVAMLYRYAGMKGYSTSVKAVDITAYPDAMSVSGYALPAMMWAVDRGIITGMAGRLEPLGLSSRAQVATILKRFILEYIP